LIFTAIPTSGTGAPLAPVPFSSLASETPSGHPLDPFADSDYCGVLRGISVRTSPEHKNRPNIWQMCVPLLLIGLLLYNPFLALANHSGGPAFEELARHRATVGASEMQHFSPMPDESALPEATVLDLSAIPVVKSEPSFSHLFPEEALPLLPVLTGSTWFRPPPAL
jgi:hypothetical protein